MQDIRRYVSIVYLAFGALAAWLFPKVFLEILALFGPSADRRLVADIPLSSILGYAAALALLIFLWKNEKVHTWLTEVCDELSKVTWPTNEETRRSTMIVVLFSIALGCVLAVMDLGGRAAIDLVFSLFS